MDKENVVHIHSGLNISHKGKKHVICMKMDRTRDHYVKQNKLDSERQVCHVSSRMWNIEEKRERQENRKETIREVERDLGMGEGG
jgi:mRNA degradation ribonuclease J1/J2